MPWRDSDVSALGGTHSELEAMRHLDRWWSVHTLNLSQCDNLNDVSALGGVHTLKLFRCVLIDDVSALNTVRSLSGCTRDSGPSR